MNNIEFSAGNKNMPLYAANNGRYATRQDAERSMRGVDVQSKVQLRDVANLRVLIVEDHPEVARLFGVLLREHGALVHICGNGDTAIADAPRFAPDVVLLDIRLPGMDGYQVAYRLLTDVLTTRPLIIAITAYSQERYRTLADEVGIDLFLTKPVTGRELLQYIEETPIRTDRGSVNDDADA
jgi:CheY-like chemotaxis protein